MSMSTFQKVTLASCLLLCTALLLPKILLSRGGAGRSKDAPDGGPGNFPPMAHRQKAPDGQRGGVASPRASRAHNPEAIARAKGAGTGAGAGGGGKSNLAGQIIPIYGFGILLYILYILFKITSRGSTKPTENKFHSVRSENMKRKITDFELVQLQEKLRETELVMENIVSKANHSPERVKGVTSDQEESLLMQLREITRVMQEGRLVEGMAPENNKAPPHWEDFPEEPQYQHHHSWEHSHCPHHHPEHHHEPQTQSDAERTQSDAERTQGDGAAMDQGAAEEEDWREQVKIHHQSPEDISLLPDSEEEEAATSEKPGDYYLLKDGLTTTGGGGENPNEKLKEGENEEETLHAEGGGGLPCRSEEKMYEPKAEEEKEAQVGVGEEEGGGGGGGDIDLGIPTEDLLGVLEELELTLKMTSAMEQEKIEDLNNSNSQRQLLVQTTDGGDANAASSCTQVVRRRNRRRNKRRDCH